MNISQLPTKERYYPFYKGKHIGNTIEGYESIETCKRKIKNSIIFDLDHLIYKEYFGSYKEYQRNNTVFYKLSKQYIVINGEVNEDIYGSGEQVFCTNLNLTDEQYKEITERIDSINKFCGFLRTSKLLNTVYEFEQTYNLYPNYYIDYNEFYKARKDLMDKIEYHKGTLTVDVNFNDNNISIFNRI